MTDEIVAMNMINTILGRMYLASHIELLSEEKKRLIKEGIEYYEKLAEIKKQALPIFPLGFTDFRAHNVAVGLKHCKTIYLAVWHLGGEKTLKIPLKSEIEEVKIGYPQALPTKYSFYKDLLNVEFGEDRQAIIFEIISR